MSRDLVHRHPVPPDLAFPIDEYRARVRRVQAHMADRGFDGLVLHQPENLSYLSGLNIGTGYFAYHALVIPAEGEPVLVLRDVEEPAAQQTCWLEQWSKYGDAEPEPVAATKRAVEDLGLDRGTIGVDEYSWYLTLERFGALRRLLPKVTFAAEPRIVDDLRLIKSANEVEYIRQAARNVEAAMTAGISAVAAGKSEHELSAAIVDVQVRTGNGRYGGVVVSGERALQFHGVSTGRKLELGDLVKYELSGVINGYVARMMRSAVVGPASEAQRAATAVLRESQDTAFEMMAPGQSAREIAEACRGPILASRLTDRYDYRVGYGLGLISYPSAGDFSREFTPQADWELEPGMVFHMLVHAQGFSLSETVLVTESGHELLTSFDRVLFET
ncbi:M24 family metallopeptidase [Nocardia sp. NPDC059239]|uniref:M24 family metallopeptidase n=1 Tax=Nocardia sp. NPDC059239 TaxID=3346785 RepID=UPI0036B063FB